MSDLGTYSFLPWLRQGLAGQITAQDGDATVKSRASVHVRLGLSAEPVTGSTTLTDSVERDVQLYGPGDIVGLDRRTIVREEPRDWITNFEPNFLAHIEFYDEGLPWRYTPAAPDPSRLRLRPWITLIVLEEVRDGRPPEFEEGRNIAGRPLRYIDVADLALLPPADELWAWAHVHVNRDLAGSEAQFETTDMGAVLPRLQTVLDHNPDHAHSRLVCPRRLAPNRAYHAFVVPTFETGRLAGLGLDPGGAPHATTSAWATYTGRPAASSMPVYHRWYFHSGSEGDFEYLVRLLDPRPVDKRVGVRDMDVREPGHNVPGIADPELGGVLKLGGALRVPRSSFTEAELEIVERYENWASDPADPDPHPFQAALAAFVNLPDDYESRRALDANAASGLGPAVESDPDPLITAPIYARWHALTQRLLVDRDGTPLDPDDNWVHELNLDPRHRVAAGFGTRVVQDQQERFMEAAWQQVGDVIAANRRIRFAQLAQQVAVLWHARQLAPLAAARPGRALALTAPVQRHVLLRGGTVRHTRAPSLVPPAITSAAMRRMTRPDGRLMSALAFDERVRPDNLVERANAGEVSAAPPRPTPPGVVTTDELADEIAPPGVPPVIADILRRHRELARVALALALVVLVLVVLLLALGAIGIAVAVVGLALAGALYALYDRLRRWSAALAIPDAIRPQSLTPEAVGALPPIPDFTITTPGAGIAFAPGTSDSPTARRLKDALRDFAELHVAGVAIDAARPVPVSIDLGAAAAGVVAALDPKVAVPKRVLHGISLPPRIAEQLDDSDFGEVMAYPEIDVPMYEPLKDISSELFLPNLNLIAQNSITLLETNQKFIESYLIGLNHEFGRELLWREYPTDQRGSYFRQFWDARGAMTPPGLDPEQRRELLRDIPPINAWRRRSELGDHDHRELPGEEQEEVVLVIRGELLKKYPNAVIYAQKAAWQLDAEGQDDPSQERVLVELTPAEEDDPPRAKLRTPLYEAKVDPDITFFGFDLTIDEARGDDGDVPDARPGWFFVIRERPGEPRFGFDMERAAGEKIQTVNDLAWPDTGTPEGGHVPAGALSPLVLAALDADDDEKQDQHADDLLAVGAPLSAARWAYLLYQAPVMVAVHATEMLSDPDG